MKKKTSASALFNTAVLLTAVNFLGKILGFLRDILISNYYGSTAQTDAFFLALSIPTILIGVFTSSADSTVVPQYSRIAASSEGRDGADRYFSNVIVLLTMIATAIAVVCLVWPQGIIRLFAPKFSGEAVAYSIRYLRIFSFAGLLHIWFCFFCAYSLCYERTTVRMILSATTNVFVVLSLLLIHDTGMYALVLAYMAGSLLSAFLPIWDSCRTGYRFRPVLSLRRHHFPEFFKLFLPVMGSALLADLLLYCDRFLSSFLAAGSLSALNYGSKVTGLFENVFVVGISAVLLPVIIRLQMADAREQLRFTISAVVFGLVLFLAPIGFLCVLYAGDLVSVLYLRGAFNEQNAQVVASVLQAYSPLILFSPLLLTLTKTFHGMSNTRLPFQISLLTFVVNVVLSFTLMQVCGVFGIAFATSVSSMLGCLLQLLAMGKTSGLDRTFLSVKNLVKLIVCFVLAALPSMLLPSMPTAFWNLLLSGGCSAVVYGVSALLLFHRELRRCWTAIRS